MSATLNLGTDGNWAVKDESILAYNSENGNYKPIPFDFSRASIGTRVNRDGLIEEVQDNIPRIDFSDGEGSLLLEPQRTNSQPYSEDLTQSSAWGLGNTTISANATTSPDGYQNADKLVETATTARHELYGLTFSYSGTSSVSFYAKAAERKYLSCFVGGDPSVGGVTFDLEAGTAPLTSGGTTAKIEAVSGAVGWYKCSFTTTKVATTTTYFCLRQTLGASPTVETYAGDGTSGIYFWGGQVELAEAYPTSYIPTSGSAVTRVADSCTKTGASDYIGQTEGTLFWDFDAKNSGGYASGFFTTGVDDGSYNNAVGLVSNSPSDTELRGIYRVGGSTGFLGSSFNVTNQRNKIAIVWTASSIKMFKNGALETTLSKSAFTTTMSYFYFPTTGRSGHYNANQILSFATALSDTELAELTTL